MKTKVKREETEGRRGSGACNHFFKRPVPVYQLLVYPLIGQIWQIISTLLKRVVPVTQKDGMRRPRAWNREIHDNFCVERMFTRFPAHRSPEEGTQDLPCELDARKKCFYFRVFPTIWEPGTGYSFVDIGQADIRIYIEPPLVHIDGQRNFNMASPSDVL